MSSINYTKDEEKYLEVLQEYSPAVINYIRDFKNIEKRDILATLLNLELKKKIEIVDNKINILDSNVNDLKITEQYVFENIKDGKVKIEREGELHKRAEEEAFMDGLIEKGKSKRMILGMIRPTIFTLIYIAIVALIGYVAETTGNQTLALLTTIMIIFAVLLVLILPLSLASTALVNKYSYKRTKLGDEVNEKVEEAKKYIKNIMPKNKETLSFKNWILIYLIMFGLKSKKIEELSKLVEIKYEAGKIYIVKSSEKE